LTAAVTAAVTAAAPRTKRRASHMAKTGALKTIAAALENA
jgi:hypothetical protein